VATAERLRRRGRCGPAGPVADRCTGPGFADGDGSRCRTRSRRSARRRLLLIAAPADAGVWRAGARVLDACAAPGGKTAHLLELADLDVLALDRDPAGWRASTRRSPPRPAAPNRAADAAAPARWWDGRPFDAILLDAPCSASGIVRRHPDVRWLRRPATSRAGGDQARLLDALWPLLAPGGRLLYAPARSSRPRVRRRSTLFCNERRCRPCRQPAFPGQLLPLPDNDERRRRPVFAPRRTAFSSP
jgi:16S rRNA (cytosine967-C5)-methyltransferase